MAGGREVPSSELLLDVEREERAVMGYNQNASRSHTSSISIPSASLFGCVLCQPSYPWGHRWVSVAPRSPGPTYLHIGTSLGRVYYPQQIFGGEYKPHQCSE